MIYTHNFFRVRTLTVIITLSALLFACGNSQHAGGGSFGNAPAPTLKVIALQPRSVTLNSEYPASIQGQQNIEIRPKVDGFVEKIYVDEGSIVKKGQLLFKINNPQYAQDERTAAAGIKTAEADVNTARLQVEKVKPLVAKDIISHYELESAQLTLQTKEAALAQAKAALVNARINVGYTTITSPVDGVIGSLPYKLGSLVNSTTADPLTTVYNTSTIYAYFAINEKELLDFSSDSTNASLSTRLKQMPPVTLILSNGITYDHKGKVETINGLINTATGSANVRAGFVNPKGLLHTGNSATISIPKALKNVLVVPQNVTYELQDKRFVYLVDAQNKVTNLAITVMDQAAGQFYIVTGGLKPGEKIVAEGANNLRDGTVIKPVEANTDQIYKGLK
ncbi:MAG TPA: efflux RND transporter periplasmic adaptor subunit [Mucilaginibacter sp.]|nr:efflux RND transporter periplasmic adaptor subunit [Mucilaginibacter sp.]